MAGTLCLCGCTLFSRRAAPSHTGESVVFVGEQAASLAYLPASKPPPRVRSTYLPQTGTVDYVEGRDYVIDYVNGTICRTPASALPDFRTNMLFGQVEFDHSQFPGFGNSAFFAFIDYSFLRAPCWPVQAPQTALLKKTRAKLKTGGTVKIVAFGDSITAGGDATKPSLIFWQRWADDLQRKYPRARVVAVNGATGGDSTVQGLQRLEAKVLAEKPDLVLIGFGMNDHNRSGVAVAQFEQNLKQMISRIRNETAAEVILFSAFPPNPNWKFGSHHMADYAAATAGVASATACAYADVFSNWQALASRKKPEDLLGNNINHPNDFGHWIYYRVLVGLGL
jgi:acyl-CoA thioesterase I